MYVEITVQALERKYEVQIPIYQSDDKSIY